MKQKEFAENLPMETPKVGKEKASKLHDVLNRVKENIKKSKAGQKAADFYAKHEKGVKIGGGVAAGTALAAGLAVGAKKLANKKKEQKEFTRADYKQLDFVGKKRLKEYRDGLAKKLNQKRNEINKDLADTLESLKGKQGGEIEKARQHAKNNATIGRAWNILDTHDNARRRKLDEEFKSIGREFNVEKSIKKHEELAAKLRAKKAAAGESLKKAGKVAAGTALVAGLAYGGKKLYDKYKKNNESDNKD